MASSYDFCLEQRDLRKFDPLGKEFAQKVTRVTWLWKNGKVPDTPDKFQEFLYNRMLSTLQMGALSEVTKSRHLEFFRKIIKNPATAIFVDLMRGTESNFFIEWLQDSMRANAYALEPAYGYGRDLNENYRQIPYYDPAIAMMEDEGFQYIRWRDHQTAELIKATGRSGKILSIACGAMPELRYFHYPSGQMKTQYFVCYDVAKIDFEMFFRHADLPLTSIHAYQMNLAGALMEEKRHMKQRKYDLVIIKGYLSYALSKLPEIIPAVVGLLQKPGAKFAFDLQLSNWTLARNADLFLWAQGEGISFDLLDGVNAAKELVSGIIAKQKLPVKMDLNLPLKTNYDAPAKANFGPLDLSAEDAAGIFVTLTKRA